ncbi:O-antigen ligase family protein [Vibrio clamense]|uniref:hypothetical protein n=1 Tax=Vibrio clamense TaxID=2910254 RepID=UPI003D25E0F6
MRSLKSIMNGYVIKADVNLLLFLILVISPLFDLATGLLMSLGILIEGAVATPSQFIRLILTVFSVYLLRRYLHFYTSLLVLCFFIFIEIFSAFTYLNISGFLFSLMNLSKLFLLAMMVMVVYRKREDISSEVVLKLIKFNSYLVSVAIIFSSLTGYGSQTYIEGFGTKSFFASGNGLGIYLGCLSLLNLFLLLFYKNKNFFLVYVLSTFALLLVGTKTCAIFFLVSIFLYFYYSKYRILFFSVLGLFVVSFWSYLYDFLIVAFDVVLFRFEKSEGLMDFILSSRVEYFKDAVSMFNVDGLYSLRVLSGLGVFVSFQELNDKVFYDTLESDVLDIFFMYGAIGFSLVFTFYCMMLSVVRRNFILLLSVILLVFHSFLAGHVLFNGMTSSLFVLILAVHSMTLKRKLHE